MTPSRAMALLAPALLAACSTACGGSSSHAAPDGTPEDPPGGTPGGSGAFFFDDFDGSSLDTGKWQVLNRAGDYSNEEQECYSPSQVSVSGGRLVITSTAQTTTCGDATHQPTAFPVLSGAVQSRKTFTYGTVEWRGTLGAGSGGQWPAVWLLGANCQAEYVGAADGTTCRWPTRGSDEIDITEMKGSAVSAQQGVCSSTKLGSCTWHSSYVTVADVSRNVHTYQLVWVAGSLTWKIDGVTTSSYSGADVPSTPMFLIINSAAGGAGGGTIVPPSYPKTSAIDYVKITQP